MSGSNCFLYVLIMTKHYKVDLHTHSLASPDGGIRSHEYEKIITENILDFVAITDHNRVDFAKKMQEKLGGAIIVGEEIATQAGEVIGLFLTEKITPGLSLAETFRRIHDQNGIIYLPHPLDNFRHGIGEMNMLEYVDEIDIIEGFNARIIWNSDNARARDFALSQGVAYGVGSDAHSVRGIGYAYAKVTEPLSPKNIKNLLKDALYEAHYQPLLGYLDPKVNRIRKLFAL